MGAKGTSFSSFVDRLNEIMTMRGVSPGRLAEQIGDTESRVKEYIAGQRCPNAVIIMKIAEALGTSPEWLYGLPEKKTMFFSEALDAMKHGAKVKLPTWAGYWEWDSEKQTVLMHCRPEESDNGEPVLDIRESQRVEYTLRNICSTEWMIADEDNCPKLGGRQTGLSFGDAINMAKRYGKKIARAGWNGKGQYVELATCISYKDAAGKTVNAEHDAIGNKAFAFVGTSGVQMGWLASQADMLATDWEVVE